MPRLTIALILGVVCLALFTGCGSSSTSVAMFDDGAHHDGPAGDGIYGAEKASTSYFNKPASALTRNEAAMIAAILPNPKKWNPVHPTSYIRNRQEWILWNMNNLGKLSY